jgi:hypothetical protein
VEGMVEGAGQQVGRGNKRITKTRKSESTK